MDVTISADLAKRVQQEFASGGYRDLSELVEEAMQLYLDQREHGYPRVSGLQEIGKAVDEAGLYERVLLPDDE